MINLGYITYYECLGCAFCIELVDQQEWITNDQKHLFCMHVFREHEDLFVTLKDKYSKQEYKTNDSKVSIYLRSSDAILKIENSVTFSTT
jgi:hypothetical protein